MADVGADARRRGQSDLGVEVGAVHVDLPAPFVDSGADFPDRVLEDAVGRRVSDHQRAQARAVHGRLRPQIREVDVALRVAGHHDRVQAGHGGARRIGAVGGGRDQDDVAVALATGAVKCANDQQPGELALGARVRLQRDGVEAGDRGEQRFELLDDPPVAPRLRRGREGMDVPELRPGDRLHLRGGIELHRARAERNHRRVEADVLALEPLQVPHHLQLGMMAVEDRVGKERRAPHQRVRPCRGRRGDGTRRGRGRSRRAGGRTGRIARGAREHLDDVLDVGGRRRLVEGDADVAVLVIAKIDARRLRGGAHRGRSDGPSRSHAQGVEERVVARDDAECSEPAGEPLRQSMHAPGDLAQSGRTVICSVHAGDVGQQRLRGADVRRGALAPDVLLAGLQRHPISLASLRVHRDADHAPRHLPRVGAAGGEERGVRPAVAERDTEALRAADHQVGVHLAGRGRQRQGEQVGGHDDQCARRVRPGGHRAQVVQAAGGVRRLHEHSEHVVQAAARPRRGPDVGHVDRDAERLGTSPHHRYRLRKAGGRDQEAPRVGSPPGLHAEQHGHRLGRRGGLVEQRRVGDLHPRQVRDGGLEVQQRLQPPLRDLGLVRGVGAVPAGVLEQVAQDDGRRHASVVAEADERPPVLVAGGEPAHPRQEGRLGLRVGQVERLGQANRRRDRLVHQGVQ